MPASDPDQSYAQPAEWYDRIYAGMAKDYAAEADVVDGIARAHCPGARTLLDVGCGTGLHLERFTQLYDEVGGVDLAPAFVERARQRCRGARVHVGDMRSFDLGRTFDVVVSLFSAIGHAGDAAGLESAIAAMARHVTTAGVLIVEPWLAPDAVRTGHHGLEISEAPGSTLVRANHTRAEGVVSVVEFAWTEVTPRGITRLDETLRLSRFSADQFLVAFQRAGMSARFDARGCNDGGRGLWVATPDGRAARG